MKSGIESTIVDIALLNANIHIRSIGLFLRVLSLLKGDPIQLKVTEDGVRLLQISNEGELLIKVALCLKNSQEDEKMLCVFESIEGDGVFSMVILLKLDLPVEDFEEQIRLAGDDDSYVNIAIEVNKVTVFPNMGKTLRNHRNQYNI